MEEQDDMTELTDKPTPPADCECCENGCSPCVWDIYFEALAEWKANQAKAKQDSENQSWVIMSQI